MLKYLKLGEPLLNYPWPKEEIIRKFRKHVGSMTINKKCKNPVERNIFIFKFMFSKD